jgi:DNA-binding response OmpR family regulator
LTVVLSLLRVLVVEDDELLGSSLCRALATQGYDPVQALTLATARASFAEKQPDLIVLDLSLPDGDGLEWCASLHDSGELVPVIMLTARAEEIDVVVGLGSGAVDYVTKPFRLAELMARISAHLRTVSSRAGSIYPATEVLDMAGVSVDVGARRVVVDENEVELRPREFDLLVRLMREAGNVVRREELIADVWDENWFGSTKTLDVHIAHLRRKFGEATGTVSRITSIRGVGYRFERLS